MKREIVIPSLFLLALLASTLAAQEIPITTTSDEARALYIQARELGDQLRLKEQKSLLEQALVKDSTFARAYLDLAYRQQTIADIRAYVAKAAVFSEKASPAEQMLAQALQAQLDNDRGKEKELREDLAHLFPNDKRVWYNLGLFEQNLQGNVEASISHFLKAIEIDPKYHIAYNNLGYAYSTLGRYDDAERTFRKYVELLPNESNPHDSYAEVLMKQGKFNESIAEYKKSLAIDSTFYFSLLGLGTDYAFIGNGDEGRAQFKKLFDSPARWVERYQAVDAAARSYLMEGNYEKAAQELERELALTLQQEDTTSAVYVAAGAAEILAQAGKNKEADSKLARAKHLAGAVATAQPTSYAATSILHAEIVLALSRNRPQEASAVLAEYKKRSAASANAYQLNEARSFAARIALQQKRHDDALAELEHADQRNAQTLFITAQVHAAKGDKAKAKEFFSKAANFNDMSWEYALVRKKAREMSAKLK